MKIVGVARSGFDRLVVKIQVNAVKKHIVSILFRQWDDMWRDMF